MEILERARLTTELLSGELPRVVAQPSGAGDFGLGQSELDELVGHALGRLLADNPGLTSAADAARSAPQDSRAWCSLRAEMEKALRKDPDKLEALWALLTAAGRRSPDETDQARSAEPAESKRRPGRVRRRTASMLAALGAVLAVALMAGLAGIAIFGVESRPDAVLLRWFAVVVLACIPGWLFLRFIVFRAASLWTEYVLNLHRLGMDEHQNLPRPPIGSSYHELWSRHGGPVLSTASNIYQQKFEAYYGKFVGTDTGRGKSVLDKSLPQVLLATVVLAAGWAAVLAEPSLFFRPLDVPLDALRFGFMGAYVFILQMLIRRFFQSDLKASAYLGAVARIITVLVIVLIVHYSLPVVTTMTPGPEVALAFLIGFFPLLGMQIVQKAVSASFRRFVDTLQTPYPLSDLDGLNIWYEARLLEEGIEDMQNLVTGNLVDILLHTRVPVGRLVDWIDQAALQLVVDPPTGAHNHRPTEDRVRLRRLGIRTATDLETVFLPQDWIAARSVWPAACNLDDKKLVDGVRCVLNRPELPGVNVVESLLKSLSNIPNLAHVRHWRDIFCTEKDLPVTAPSAESDTAIEGAVSAAAGANGHQPE